MQASGIVETIFPDDDKGTRHQKFAVKIKHNRTVLVVHNIDISSRIKGLKVGDKVEFSGQYQWNRHGGLVHWTHKDPNGVHPAGWIKYKDKIYT